MEACQHKDLCRHSVGSSPCGTPWEAWISPWGSCQTLYTQGEVIISELFSAVMHHYLYVVTATTTCSLHDNSKVSQQDNVLKCFQVFWLRAQSAVGRLGWGSLSFPTSVPCSPQRYHSVMVDGSFFFSGAFFFSCASLLTALQGPELWQHKLLLHPSSSRDLHTHWPSLHTSSHQQFTGEQCWMKGLRWVRGWHTVHVEGWKEEKAEVQEHCSTTDWARAAQSETLIEGCQCSIILVGLASCCHNIIVVLLYWSTIQQFYHEHNGNENWRDGSFVLAAEPFWSTPDL